MLEGDNALESSEELGLSSWLPREIAKDAPHEGLLSYLPQHWSEGLGRLKDKPPVSCVY